jgi:hypothetical protein
MTAVHRRVPNRVVIAARLRATMAARSAPNSVLSARRRTIRIAAAFPASAATDPLDMKNEMGHPWRWPFSFGHRAIQQGCNHLQRRTVRAGSWHCAVEAFSI